MRIIRLGGCILLGTLLGVTTAGVFKTPADEGWIAGMFCLAYIMALFCLTYIEKG